MHTVVIGGNVRIPVDTLEAFCRWAGSPDYPEQGWYSYLHGDVWVDTSMEEMNHNQVKGAFAVAVGGLVMTERLGRYFHDRMRLSNTAADLATEPDGMFVSRACLLEKRVRLLEGGGDSPVRVEGTPDMVLEVISPSSVKKDTDVLRELYWKAGIPEYWLVDPGDTPAAFEILKHASREYVAVRKQRGWLKSAVLGRSLQLTQQADELGHPEYLLTMR